MFRVRSRVVGGWILAAGLAGTAVVGACAEKKGGLMLAINTDMKAPKDVNAVSVTISTNGAIKHSFIGRVTPQGEVLLPATLAIVEPDDGSASIRVRVMAFQDRKPRVLRDVRTSIPGAGRTALLRIPLNFVNDKSAMGGELPNGIVPDPFPGSGGSTGGSSGSSGSSGGTAGGGAGDFDFFGSFQPPCPDIENQTIIDGECKDNFIDPETLPDFDSADLGDSTDVGSCFDLQKCFSNALGIGETGGGEMAGDGGKTAMAPPDAGADERPDATPPPGDPDGGKFKAMDLRPSAVTLDRNTCSLQLNGANPTRLNLAIVTPDTGECVRPGECYIPIDRGDSGWKEENGRVQLPSFVCKLLSGKNLRLATSTETCAAKEEKNPICTPKAGTVGVDDGGIPVTAELVVAENFPTTVIAGGTTLIFAGSTAAGIVTTTSPGSTPMVTKIDVPAAALPWRFGSVLQGGFGALTNGTNTGYMLQSNGAQMNFTVTPVLLSDGAVDVSNTRVVEGNKVLAWAIDQQGPFGGVFTNAPAGAATKANLPNVTNATAILGNPSNGTVVIGDGQGGVRACFLDLNQCGQATNLGSRIDALTVDPRRQLAGYALTQSGVYTSTVVDQQTGRIDAVPIAMSNTSALVVEGKRYPRSLITSGNCVVFSSANGVEYTLSSDGKPGASSVVVPASGRNILGVAVGIGIGGQPQIFYTVFASAAQGGGIYRAPLPPQCGGSTSTGGGTCVPRTCAEQKFECGPGSDTCGNILNCGTCGGDGGDGGGVCQNNKCVPL